MSRGYDQLAWVDYPETLTPISAANLNRMENGIANLYTDRNKLESNMAYVEDGDTSSRHYDIDAYLMHNGVFYKVTEEINIGDTLDYGLDGNIAHVDISSQFGSGGGGSTGCVELTQAQYDALSEEAKMADVIYLITDSPDNYVDEVFGDFASVEPTSTASKAYEAGDYLVYDNKFYLVSDDIAQGDTITPGTNVEQTTVGEEFTKTHEATSIIYNNTQSGLAADNVQEAIDELGVKTSTAGNFSSQVANFSDYSLRKTDNLVVFTGNFNPQTASLETWTTIGTIPSAYRPLSTVYYSGCDAWGHTFIMNAHSNGNIQIFLNSGSYANGYCFFNMTWFTA